MALGDDLKGEVYGILRERWERSSGIVVPDADKLPLRNKGVDLDATVLYADLDGSTAMVDGEAPEFAAEVYKTFLRCAAKTITNEGGVVTAYDGDRVMAVFVGDSKNTSAVRAGLKINYCVKQIINPAIKEIYRKEFAVRHTVGIDTSALMVAKTGVRGANDLVWVGRAANYAAKLTTLSSEFPTWITGAVFDKLAREAKFSGEKLMWEARSWTAMGGIVIHRSNYTWRV